MKIIFSTLHSKYIHASLALPYLATYCGDLNCDIEIKEFTTHEPKENILALLLENDPDVVVFSVYLWNRCETLELVDALAIVNPGIKIVLGGPEVSFDCLELFDTHPGLSVLVRGEGELPLHGLLKSWLRHEAPHGIPRLAWRNVDQVVEGPDGPLLENLDDIPSPFAAGLVDPERGFTYLETSRGCPYRCSFCMSSRDPRVRSFSMERIQSDLKWLMEHEVPKIKLVDRTFNYDAARARDIFNFILQHNNTSHFHFEVGAHLLDDETLTLLAKVPGDTFQFEIGVQSTSNETLHSIDRQVALERLEQNVTALHKNGNIHVHLDLIAGLPGEGYVQFKQSIDRIMALIPDHLQIEPVKLLPGSPLRGQANALGIHFDPHPPYTVLGTPDLSYSELQKIRCMSRLLDMTWNHGRACSFLNELAQHCGSFADGLEKLALRMNNNGDFRHPLSQRGLFEAIADALERELDGEPLKYLRIRLARDYALSERVSPAAPPVFFDTALTPEEAQRVKGCVDNKLETIRGRSIKLQHFSCIYTGPIPDSRQVAVYLYTTQSGAGLTCEEILL